MPVDDHTRALFEATEAAQAADVTFRVVTQIKPEPHRELTIWMPLTQDWHDVALRLFGAIRDAYTVDEPEVVQESHHGTEDRRGKGRAKARISGRHTHR